jgi:hypothetical protein
MATQMKLLYICSSQFSGTTLTSFLLNSHSQIATIGHTTGWPYAGDEDFRCSCGSRIRECRLFSQIRKRFEENGLPFDPQNFGTDYRLADNARFNQILIGPLPGLRFSSVEYIRDTVVRRAPGFRRQLATQERANVLLMQTVLDFYNASVYLDNSHSPYRFRRLSQSAHFSVLPIHLVRDPRGVSLSLMTNSGYSVSQAVESWLGHQTNIHRVTTERTVPIILMYESLCRDTERELGKIHGFAGVAPEPLPDDFKIHEHHILGNRMRLKSGEIRLDERWRHDLAPEDRRLIENRLSRFCAQHRNHPISGIIETYLQDS